MAGPCPKKCSDVRCSSSFWFYDIRFSMALIMKKVPPANESKPQIKGGWISCGQRPGLKKSPPPNFPGVKKKINFQIMKKIPVKSLT